MLSLRRDIDDEAAESERTGIFTSGIVSTQQGRQIALFFTGRQHAGENLRNFDLPIRAGSQLLKSSSKVQAPGLISMHSLGSHRCTYFEGGVAEYASKCRKA